MCKDDDKTKGDRDMYSLMAMKALDLACSVDEVIEKHPEERSLIKYRLLGLSYGLTWQDLAKSLGVDENELPELIAKFEDAYAHEQD